jgi:hypothetical protein
VYEKVQEILGMRRGNNKVVVYLYPDEEKLHTPFMKCTKGPAKLEPGMCMGQTPSI